MKNNLFKRTLAVLLVVLMMIPSVPTFSFASNEENKLPLTGLKVLDLSASYTEASNSNGSAVWSVGEDGKSITGAATGYKSMGIFSKEIDTNLYLKNDKNVEAVLTFNYVKTGGGSVSFDSKCKDQNGSVTATIPTGQAVTIKLTSPKSQSTNNLKITNISLKANTIGSISTTFKKTQNGSYTVDGTYLTEDKSFEKDAGASFVLVATPNSNYKLFGWVQEKKDGSRYISFDKDFEYNSEENAVIYPVFVPSYSAKFQVGDKDYFTDLDDAVNFAIQNSLKQVTLVESGTINDTSYTIPAGITLLVPYSNDYNLVGEKPVSTSSWSTPSAYVTLTLGEGTRINVNGAIEVGSKFRYCSGGNVYGNSPTGKYGAIYMSSGSNITLNSGANLYAWGYVYGEGSVVANNGSKIYEFMQITDFCGGTNLGNTERVFPFSQYYVQNIEVPLTLNYGATEYLYVKLVVAGYELPAAAPFIGITDDSMFKMNVGSSVTKKYDPTTDRLIIDIDGDASLQSVSIEPDLSEYSWDKQLLILGALSTALGTSTINSANYILCLNSNMTINVNSGMTTISQEVSALPGVEIVVDKNAILNLASGNSAKTTASGGDGGKNAYLFDSEQWGNYVYNNKKLVPVTYSPSKNRYKRTESDLKDVVLDVNGRVITNGYLYSTVDYEYELDENDKLVSIEISGGGASVISSEGTGKIIMQNGAGSEMGVYNHNGAATEEITVFVASVQLKNGDGSYLDTTGAAPGTTFDYCATHSKWYTGECETCASAPIKYEITWVVNGDSSTSDVDADTTPVYPGGTPVKTADDTYHYIFAGWSKTENGSLLNAIPVASAKATYYAVFSPAQHSFKSEVVNGYHACKEATCGKKASCSDADGDGNHVCDLGCSSVLTECKGGTASCEVKAVCDECNQPYGDYAECKPGAAKEENRIEATCGSEGSYDNVVRCTVCNDVLSTEKVTIPASGKHSDGTDKNHNCDVCGEPDVSSCVPGTPVIENVTDATCNAGGSYDKVVYCTVCEAKMSSETVTTQSSGHTWSTVTYKWSEDYKTCTATRTCTSDSSHVESETVQSVPSIKTDATCTEKGWTTYTAKFENVDWAAVQTKDVQDIKKAPHGSVNGFIYEDLKNGTHEIICNDCKNTIDIVEHKFENNHECVCGAVDTFDLTILDWNSENVEFAVIKVPFGAKIEDYIKDVVISDIKTENGVYKFNGEWYTKNSDEEADDVPETMPGENLTIYANLNYTGWLQSGDGWIYDVDDVTMYGWYCVDGSWYYLDEETGYRATGITRVPYPTEAINGITYGPVAEDKAYWESHKSSSKYTDAETARFIFDEDGKFNSFTGIVENERYAVNGMIGWHIGLVDVNGDYYYFKGDDKTNGGNIMAKGDVYVTRIASGDAEIGGCYTFGDDGKLCKYDGITKVNNVLRYYDDARLVMDKGLIKVGEYYYYIRSNGDIVVDSEYYVPAEKLNGYDIVEGKYNFDENGRMIRPIDPSVYNGIVEIDGKYYYYENGKQLKNKGVVELKDDDGKTFYIYIRSNGQLATGDYWPTKRNKLLPAGVYDWGADGKYYPVVPSFATGIYEVDGDYYYYVDGVKQKNSGIVKLTDENQKVFYIYVRYNGKLATGNYWPTNRNGLLPVGLYNWGSDGKYYPTIPEFATGIYEINGEYYYYVDGVRQKNAGVVKLTDENQNDYYIYVRYNGKLAKGNYWPTNRNNLLSRGIYNWGADGRYYPA